LTRADFVGSQWHLATSQGSLAADVLVMATGIWSAPVQPQTIAAATFGGPIIHSSAYRNPQSYLGQRVLVVGTGNSGSEIAVDLAEHGVSVAIAVRSGAVFGPKLASPQLARAMAWMFRTLPRPIAARLLRRRDFRQLGLPLPPGSPLDHFPVVGYDLPNAVAAGRVVVYPALECVSAGTAHFADGRVAPFDAMIMATGYRPALNPVAHALTFDKHGRPLLDEQWRARTNLRLVCVGYTYPTTEGWIQALGRVARSAAEGIAQLV
jgi:cation diffusion facilitator CzcD-associated flavoprotein CzcO